MREYSFNDYMADKKTLDEKLREVLAKKVTASDVVRKIKELHGEDFIHQCLKGDVIKNTRKNHKGDEIRERYRILKEHNPYLSAEEIRKIISQEFNIKDKSIQHHLYKKN